MMTIFPDDKINLWTNIWMEGNDWHGDRVDRTVRERTVLKQATLYALSTGSRRTKHLGICP